MTRRVGRFGRPLLEIHIEVTMRLITRVGLMMGAGLFSVVAGCATNEEPTDLKRDRDRLSYQVTELQSKLDKANAEINRLKAENATK